MNKLLYQTSRLDISRWFCHQLLRLQRINHRESWYHEHFPQSRSEISPDWWSSADGPCRSRCSTRRLKKNITGQWTYFSGDVQIYHHSSEPVDLVPPPPGQNTEDQLWRCPLRSPPQWETQSRPLSSYHHCLLGNIVSGPGQSGPALQSEHEPQPRARGSRWTPPVVFPSLPPRQSPPGDFWCKNLGWFSVLRGTWELWPELRSCEGPGRPRSWRRTRWWTGIRCGISSPAGDLQCISTHEAGGLIELKYWTSEGRREPWPLVTGQPLLLSLQDGEHSRKVPASVSQKPTELWFIWQKL